MKWSDYLAVERATIDGGAPNLLINLLPDLDFINKSVRPAVARVCGMSCGAGVVLHKGIVYGNPKNVSLGTKSIVGRGSFLDSYERSRSGAVAIAFQVTFITSTHEAGTQEQRMGELSGSPIVIGDNVWIAAQAIIGPGTKIGAGSTIFARATWMRSVPAQSRRRHLPVVLRHKRLAEQTRTT
jgi:maltose O-acetyltransferase